MNKSRCFMVSLVRRPCVWYCAMAMSIDVYIDMPAPCLSVPAGLFAKQAGIVVTVDSRHRLS